MANTRICKEDQDDSVMAPSERGRQPQEEKTKNQGSIMVEIEQMFQDMSDQNREQIHKIIKEKVGPILNTIRPLCSYKTFLSSQPPEFSGSTDPIAILRWITKMEWVFDLCECGESQKVKFAVSMLKGNAWSWWYVTQELLGKETASNITWSEFVKKEKERYCSPSDIDVIGREFLRLEKGNMTVDEYACLFVEKLLCVGHWVPRDENRVARFVSGLPSIYSKEVGKAKTLNEAICEAKRVEYIEKEKQKAEDVGEKRKGGGALGSFKKVKGEVKPCYNCGIAGHLAQECWNELITLDV